MNAISIIAPFRYAGQWVFDDPAVGLIREPFVVGIDTEWRRPEFEGNWYYCPQLKLEGWLCPALFKYFDHAPQELYERVEAQTEGSP